MQTSIESSVDNFFGIELYGEIRYVPVACITCARCDRRSREKCLYDYISICSLFNVCVLSIVFFIFNSRRTQFTCAICVWDYLALPTTTTIICKLCASIPPTCAAHITASPDDIHFRRLFTLRIQKKNTKWARFQQCYRLIATAQFPPSIYKWATYV